jgi:hypothetical protein
MSNTKNTIKINKKGLLISFIITLILWYAPTLNPEAGKYSKIINTIYEQLVVNGNNTASFTSTEDIELHELEAELCKADNDSLYDGAALINRGRWSLTKKGNSYTVTIQNAYNINEADRLAEDMANEVRKNAGADATEDVLFYEMTNYIKETYTYDHLDHTHQNFVESYNTDRKLVCTGYAQVTYLLAEKLGLDADTVFGKDHVYNIIKVNGDYIAYDASCELCIYGFVPDILGRVSSSTNAQIIMDKEDKAYNLALNEGKTFRYANMGDITSSMAYNLLKYHRIYEILIIVAMVAAVIGFATIIVKKLGRKTTKAKRYKKKGYRYAR